MSSASSVVESIPYSEREPLGRNDRVGNTPSGGDGIDAGIRREAVRVVDEIDKITGHAVTTCERGDDLLRPPAAIRLTLPSTWTRTMSAASAARWSPASFSARATALSAA